MEGEPVPPPVHRARIYTSIITGDRTKGELQKQFFVVPLLPPPPLVGPSGLPAYTAWSWFMTNVLSNRGYLGEGAWVPEKMIELIVYETSDNPLTSDQVEHGNVVQFKR